MSDLDEKIASGELKWRTAHRIWAIVSKLFRDASRSKRPELRAREDNPAADVSPPDRGDDRSASFLYPREFLQLMTCEEIPLEWRRIFALSIYLYTRASELFRLRWEDIDLENGIVHVRRAWDRYRRREKGTKGRRPRQFRIEPTLLPLLRAIWAETGGTGRVCRIQPSGVAGHLHWALKAAGITRPELFTDDALTKRLTFHDLRATGITWMALRKEPPLVIQDRAGHQNLNVTQRYIRAAERLGDVGEPFPPLPECLNERKPSEFLSGRAKMSEIIRKRSQSFCVQLRSMKSSSSSFGPIGGRRS